MMQLPDTLNKHKDFSQSRLRLLEEEIAKIQELNKFGNLCVYATGSFGRHEATKFSDVDLFFIGDGKSTSNGIPQLSKILIDADLIRIAERMGFPPFSNDGQFLQIHYLDDIKAHLGSSNDDFSNFFTARLLLLLESFPVFNEKYYDVVVSEMLETYYRDFHKHTTGFLPKFLVNDIIRYWKTLCLNYEHKRNRQPTDEIKKLKSHVKNLKLVFSRKLTCFSFIVQIISNEGLDIEGLLKIVKMTPIERLQGLSQTHSNLNNIIEQIFELYAWFIELNDRPEDDLLDYMRDENKKNIAFEKGRIAFGDRIFDLITELTKSSPEILKYLVI